MGEIAPSDERVHLASTTKEGREDRITISVQADQADLQRILASDQDPFRVITMFGLNTSALLVALNKNWHSNIGVFEETAIMLLVVVEGFTGLVWFTVLMYFCGR